MGFLYELLDKFGIESRTYCLKLAFLTHKRRDRLKELNGTAFRFLKNRIDSVLAGNDGYFHKVCRNGSCTVLYNHTAELRICKHTTFKMYMRVDKSGNHYFSCGVYYLCIFAYGLFSEGTYSRYNLICDCDFRFVNFSRVYVEQSAVFYYHIGCRVTESYVDNMIVHNICLLKIIIFFCITAVL